MVTYCNILRTNRTMGHIKVKDKEDDSKFEGGLYFIRKEKVYLDKKGIRGKIRPTLLYVEGIADPVYLDNFKIKEYEELVEEIGKDGKPIKDAFGTVKKVKKIVHKLEDIFIDARAIHNMTDKKILSELSAQPSITKPEIALLVLAIITIALVIVSIVA